MNFIEKRKSELKIKSLGDLRRSGLVKDTMNTELFVHGPPEFDCLTNRWSRGELMGVVGDSGCGKSEVCLYIMAEILRKNPKTSAIYVSMEMTDDKLSQRWFSMTKDMPEIADRLYIISRYDENGVAKQVSMPWIKKELVKYKEALGDIAIYALDHLHCIGENDTSTLNSIMMALKEACVELNAFGICMAQVNKGAGQKGEVPLDADSVLGCSQFKYITSDIIQIHRPILRLEEEAKMSVMAWGYCKIREPHASDKVKRGQNKLMLYDLTTRSFRKLTQGEMTNFKTYYNDLLAMKTAEEKHKSFAYDLTKEIVAKDGKVITITEKFSGDVSEDY